MMGSERYGAVIEARDHPHSVGCKKNRMSLQDVRVCEEMRTKPYGYP